MNPRINFYFERGKKYEKLEAEYQKKQRGKIMFRKGRIGLYLSIWLLAVSWVIPVAVDAKSTVVKIATVTPEGSTWTKILNQFAKEVKKQTGGDVECRIYAGGVSGDEMDVLRKMRVNRIHAAWNDRLGDLLVFTILFSGSVDVEPEVLLFRLCGPHQLHSSILSSCSERAELNRDLDCDEVIFHFTVCGQTGIREPGGGAEPEPRINTTDQCRSRNRET